jgi:hypothetical protein
MNMYGETLIQVKKLLGEQKIASMSFNKRGEFKDDFIGVFDDCSLF